MSSDPCSQPRHADGDPDTGSTASGYPVADIKAVVNAAGNGFATAGLFCATTDESPTIFVDSRLANGGTVSDNLAAPGDAVAQRGQNRHQNR